MPGRDAVALYTEVLALVSAGFIIIIFGCIAAWQPGASVAACLWHAS
jgi:hypothetical protein